MAYTSRRSCTESSATRAPRCGRFSTSPSAASRRSASRIGIGLISSLTARSSIGSRSPGCSDPDLSAEDVALGYKNLLEAERGFRDMKSTLELRPVFHRLEHRIRAHVLICWLALLLIRVAERQIDHTWRRIALELQRLHLVTLTGPDGIVEQTTPASALATRFLAATQVKAPPRITAITPA